MVSIFISASVKVVLSAKGVQRQGGEGEAAGERASHQLHHQQQGGTRKLKVLKSRLKLLILFSESPPGTPTVPGPPQVR